MRSLGDSTSSTATNQLHASEVRSERFQHNSMKLKKGRVLHAVWKQILQDTGRVWKSERWSKMAKKDPQELRSKSQAALVCNDEEQDDDHKDDVRQDSD